MSRLVVAALLTAAALSHSAFAEPKLVAVEGAPGLLLAPVKVLQSVADGRIKADVSQFDAGKPSDLFDGNYATFLRSPSQSQLSVTVQFSEPVSLHGIRVKMIDCRVEYTLSAADQGTGASYKVLKSGTTPQVGDDIVFAGASQVTYSSFRLDVRRVEGDDVRIAEWELLGPVTPKELKVDYKVRTSHGDGEKAVYRPLDQTAERPVDSLFIPHVLVACDDGRAFDATGIAKVSSKSKGVGKWEISPNLVMTRPGNAAVVVEVAGLRSTGTIRVTPRPYKNSEPDLDVLWIERLPRIDFDAPNGGWPKPGQKVIWRAHVQNWGRTDLTTDYQWKLDGEFTTGQIAVPAGKEVTVDLPWKWEKTRHTLSFGVDPENRIAELVEHNNSLEIATDALTVGFYVDRSYADKFHEDQYKLGIDDANSFADWGQRIIRQWNKMLANSRYPEAPNGALDRVRLDLVRVVPDQAIPFQGGDWPTNFANLNEKSVDLLWGFPYKFDQWEKPIDIEAVKKDIAKQNLGGHWFFLDLALIHELNHARYLIDTYGCDTAVGGKTLETSSIKIKDDQGRWICGLYLQKEGAVHWDHYEGDMGGPYEIYGPYEIVMLNRIAGQRAQGGNCNGTSQIGSFLQDIPAKFKIKFAGPNGEVLANDPVKVYWAAPKDEWYGKLYDNDVDREFTTDAEGSITTDKFFFAKDGKLVHTYGHSNLVTIVRIDHAEKTYYVFVEATEANMLANVSKDPVPIIVKTVPLRTGEPVPLPADYERRRAPDWHFRTLFDFPK